MIPMVKIWSRLGLTGGLLPLAVIYVSFTLPFSIWMLRSHFAGIPVELEEAAMVDGATRAQAFISIILPLARPGIIATFIFTFILSWNEVLFASIFASSQENVVVSTTLANLLNERQRLAFVGDDKCGRGGGYSACAGVLYDNPTPTGSGLFQGRYQRISANNHGLRF